MRRFHLCIVLTSIFFLAGCATSKYQPIERIQDQKEKFHTIIDDTTAKQYAGKNYQSLSYGQMKVFKPEAFVKLDSIYSVKEKYLNNNNRAGLKRSGIEDLIPGYRAAAQEEVDKIQYEIEHVFQTESEGHIHIYHSFFLFNYKDSLLSITPFYDYKIAKNKKELFYKYLFGYHFVDDRNLQISLDEQDFIGFFKQREMELIETDELEPFMAHVMNMMKAAKELHTVDFREIGRGIAYSYFINNHTSNDIEIDQLGKLYEIKENDKIQYYELEIDWSNKVTDSKFKTIYTFSPYLEKLDVKTNKIITNQNQ